MSKSLRIESSSFGIIVINGKTYKSDLIIYPDGHITDSWRRKSGHTLLIDDIDGLIQYGPEVIIAGTGHSGLVKPEKGLEKILSDLGIQFISAPNQEAVELYNNMGSKKRVGACFHLAC